MTVVRSRVTKKKGDMRVLRDIAANPFLLYRMKMIREILERHRRYNGNTIQLREERYMVTQ